ncbi:hypothetical protein JN11_02947 [Mucilaginibacter frigoritolerans]|uniref:Uncharacterized protein n=1 Tax=Mucilaginibacter frigoritolerans TaxID=652788 RepID=A0A562TYS1_9SPHI|nr:hypothetical protein [Mucilaginibacter frigoritolerans]TWI98759.1 hypothetical protein JN11_02947 [Mucilaginibacter frigoritolerans]
MKNLILLSLIFGLILSGCSSDTKSEASKKTKTDTTKLSSNSKAKVSAKDSSETITKDKEEIQTLIRNMLIWADSGKGIDLLPILSKDSICTGFDFDKEKQTLEKLKETGFFAEEFINNYDQIIQTLDKKIKNKEFEPWNVYELPPFVFANDSSPWCSCQDNFPWGNVEVEVIKLSGDKGELKWNWGKLDPRTDPSWKDFGEPFKVVKEDGKWKISYLRGFDYEESIK